MVSGHSYLEVDSMHATIERMRKHRKIYTPYEYTLVFEIAKNQVLYKVKMMCNNDFIDLQNLSKCKKQNYKKTSEGNRVSWLKIKRLRFNKKVLFT